MWFRDRIVNKLVRKTQLYNDVLHDYHKATAKVGELGPKLAVFNDRIQAIVDKMFNVSAQKPPNRKLATRIVVEIDTEMLEHGFIHGDDDIVLKHAGELVGCRVYDTLRRRNFERWEI